MPTKTKPPARLLKQMRAICLSLPDTEQTDTGGKPHFRIAGKIFAGCSGGSEEGKRVGGGGADAVTIGFKLEMGHAAHLIAGDDRCERAPYVGYRGWVPMDASRVDGWDEVRGSILESYRLIAPKRTVKKLDGDDPAPPPSPPLRRSARKAAKKKAAKRAAE